MNYGLVICQANCHLIMTEHLNKRFKDILTEMNDSYSLSRVLISKKFVSTEKRKPKSVLAKPPVVSKKHRKISSEISSLFANSKGASLSVLIAT